MASDKRVIELESTSLVENGYVLLDSESGGSKKYLLDTVASPQRDGLMSAEDKAKLDDIPDDAEANVIDVITVNGTQLVPEGGTVDITVPTNTSDLNNDDGFITTETDPTVPAWAKSPSKPSYTASEVGALQADTFIPTKTSELFNDSGFLDGEGPFDATKLTGTVPAANLPSYVDDVIEGYYYNSKFYQESSHTTEITGETGKIYVDLPTNVSYRWSGSAYISIGKVLEYASQAEAEAGSNNEKVMTPLRTKQAIAATTDAALSATSENAVQNKAVKSALDLKANLNSPTFTGTPTGPTAATGTNTTQLATTAFVQQEISSVKSDIEDLEDALVELAGDVAGHEQRLTNVENRLNAAQSLRKGSDGYYVNESITAYFARNFDGKIYGYSEPKTTATEVTKTGANAGLANPTLGTATVAGSSTYRYRGPFQWEAAKGHVDPDGVPHIKVIRGVDSDEDWDACDENVWSIRPICWWYDDDSGSAEIGLVSDTWHQGLEPNPHAYLPDGTLRPYMLAPRYELGFENGIGVSKSGMKCYGRNVSHNSLITLLDYANTGYSGKSVYEQWYDVFFSRMIYGTKDFQTIMQGCTSYTLQYHPAIAETGVKRVILTNAQANNLLVGSTMMMGNQAAASTDRNSANCYNVFDGLVISSIEAYDSSNKAVYFDTDTTFDTDPAYLLSTAPWHSGSCDDMDWDGSPTNPQSAKEVAFFQGCEILHGATEILAGVIISNDGTTGWTPYTVEDTRNDATSLTSNFVSCGDPLPTDTADSWKYPKYVSSHKGLMYGTDTGGSTTTGASDGHYTNKLATVGIREWRSSGDLGSGRDAGPSYVFGRDGVGYAYWRIWSRLSGVGRGYTQSS